MAKLLKLRRGTDTQHNSFTGAEGEVTVNTTNDSLHVHDGSTAGGTELAKADLSNVDGSLSNNLGFADSTKALFGTGNDLEIYHDGSNSYIKNNTGVLRVHGTEVQIKDEDNNETLAVFHPQGSVDLYYDNSQKLATTSGGINVTGTVDCDGITINGNGTLSGGDLAIGSSTDTSVFTRLDFEDSGGIGFVNLNAHGTADFKFLHNRTGSSNTGIPNSSGGIATNYAVPIYFANSATPRAYFDTSGHFRPASNNTYDLGSGSEQWRHAYFDGQVNCDGLSVGGGATFDGGTSTTITVKCDDGGKAEIEARGDSQGTGVLYAGQDGSHGGGVFYNGDGSPAYATGEASDRVSFFRRSSGTNEVVFSYSYSNNTTVFRGNVLPSANNSFDLGDGSNRWRNVYTNDLNLSNEGGSNDVDGTWGSWTIQEGEDDLFLLNRRNGKKYKFNLSEVN